MIRLHQTLIVCVLAALAACAKAPPVVTDSFYRLSEPQISAPASAPALSVLVVKPFVADGLHSDRAILYQEQSATAPLKQYTYHFWEDAPPKLLQQQLIRHLRAASFSRMVVGDVESGEVDVVIRGRIDRLEREVIANNATAKAALELRADRQGAPIFVKTYTVNTPAVDDSMPATAAAFTESVNSIFNQFAADLQNELKAKQ